MLLAQDGPICAPGEANFGPSANFITMSLAAAKGNGSAYGLPMGAGRASGAKLPPVAPPRILDEKRAVRYYRAVYPPSTTSSLPVANFDSRDAR